MGVKISQSHPVPAKTSAYLFEFKIYSAPRAKDGRYRFCDEKPLHIKSFETLSLMKEFWETTVLAATSTMFGEAYELSMVVVCKNGQWDFVGDPRYANNAVLCGKPDARRNGFLE